MNLKSKKVLLAAWGCENPKDTYMYQIYYLMLKKIFPNLETFDTKKRYFQSGKDEMNSELLRAVKEKRYDLILFAMDYDELYIETLSELKNLYSQTKLVIIICDDDVRFDSWSRYYALFFEGVIQSPEMQEEYEKDGIKDSFFHWGYNTIGLNPMNLKKIYDVTFIGRPKADRNEAIKYLLDNKINIKLFGWDWYKYPEFKDIYLGPLNQEDYSKVINQTKINLIPSKGGYPEEKKYYNIKGRTFEVGLCKSFQLIERFPILLKVFSEKEIGIYDSQEDMLEKVKYYLKNEKEREKKAERAYNKILKDYNRENQLIKIFTEIFKDKKIKKLPEINKKIIVLEKEDLYSDLTEKLKDIDYITFKSNNLRDISKFKDYFLMRALDITNKNIACCDYYVSSFGLKNFMVFTSKFAFKRIGDEANKLIDINQLMIKKSYFLNHLEDFQKLANGKSIILINEENTAFVSIPLISINQIKKIEYEKMKKAFEMKFPNNLFSLVYKKRILTNPYPYLLFLKSLRGNLFILKYIIDLIKDKGNRDKLSVNRAYIENPPSQKK